MFRRRKPPATTPPEPADDVAAVYRPVIADAVAARTQFAALVDGVAEGPLRQRLAQLSTVVDRGVEAVATAARHATRLDTAVAALDADGVTARLKAARRSGEDEALIEALTERFNSTQRLLNARDEVASQLPVLEARLGTAVARVAELTLTSSLAAGPGRIDELGDELTGLADELGALGRAADELD